MKTPEFNAAYESQLRESYSPTIVDQIVGEPHYVQLNKSDQLPYVRVSDFAVPPKTDHPTVYIPGFGEGIINKASFAAEMAKKGVDFILPGQNRGLIIKDAANPKRSTDTQAENYLALIEHEVPEGPVDIVTHSYGSLVFQAMAKMRPERFANSRVVFLAPAGTIPNESLPQLGVRWVKMLKSENPKKQPMDFPDFKNVTGKASMKTLLSNIPRMIGELRDLAHEQVDYHTLSQRVGSLAVLSYAFDELYPQEKQELIMRSAVQDDGVVWATPVWLERLLPDYEPEEKRSSHVAEGAVHDDEQFNPERVARAVVVQLAKKA